MIHPLEETGHVGYLTEASDGHVVLIDPPLTFDPAACRSTIGVIVETSLPGHRVSGSRLIANECEVLILAPVATEAMTRVNVGDDILDLLHVGPVLERPEEIILMMDNERAVFVGSLDRDVTAERARRHLAESHPGAQFYGSAGQYDAGRLVGLAPEPYSGLNREAVILTNLGAADMFWADPRFVEPAEPTSRSQLVKRMAGPWPPAVISLSGPLSDLEARELRPEALASSFGSLAGERELVIWSQDPYLAEQAAGFLRRLGLSGTSWLRD